MLSQLASLSALAEQTANAFPDLDDPADLEGDEPGDATVLRSGPEPRQPGRGRDREPDDAPTETVGSPRPGRRRRPRRARTAVPRAGSGGGKAAPQPEPEVDGDATVLISSNDLPAGTQHLSSGQKGTTGSN